MMFIVILFFIFNNIFSKYENILPIRLNITNVGVTEVDVLITVSTHELIQNSTMTSDCEDLIFTEKNSTTTLPYWIESGCGENMTHIWVRLYYPNFGFYFMDMHYNDPMWNFGVDRNRSTLSSPFVFPMKDSSCPSGYSSHSEAQNRFARISKENGEMGAGGRLIHSHSFTVYQIYPDLKRITNWYGQVSIDQDVVLSVVTSPHTHSLSPCETNSIEHFPPYYNFHFCTPENNEKGVMLISKKVFMSTESDLETKYPTGKFRKMEEMNGLFPRFSSPIGHQQNYGSQNHSHNAGASTTFFSDGINKEKYHFYSGFTMKAPLDIHFHPILAEFELSDHIPPFRDIIFYEVLEDIIEGPYENTLIWTVNKTVPLGWEDYSTNYHQKYLRGSKTDSVTTGGNLFHGHILVPGSNGTGEFFTEPGTFALSKNLSGVFHSKVKHVHDVHLSSTVNSNNDPGYVNFGLIKRKFGRQYETAILLNDIVQLEWWCFGYNHKDEETCESNGWCFDSNYCICNEKYYGSRCHEFISPNGFYKKKNEIYIEWNVDVIDVEQKDIRMKEKFDCSIVIENDLDDDSLCTWKNEKLTRTSYLVITNTEEKLKDIILIPITQSSSRVSVSIDPHKKEKKDSLAWIAAVVLTPFFIIFSQIFLCCLGIYCLCFFCCCICIFTLPVFGIVFLRQRKGISKLNMIDDIDLLLIEQNSRKQNPLREMNVNSLNFIVNYEDIKILERIGNNISTSRIYRVKWKGKTCAFKSFKFNDICQSQYKFQEFEREVEILGSVNHPSVLRFYGACLKEPRIGILMEFCHHFDLANFLQTFPEKFKGAQLENKEKIRILREIACGMEYVHSRSIIHRDLKSSNILLNNLIEAKIMDFGLSKIVVSLNEEKTRKIGTSWYMAPEVVRGEDYTDKCDVFSYGVIMFEVICNNFEPFGKNPGLNVSIEFKIAQDPTFRPAALQRVSSNNEVNWLIPIWRRCWDNHPSQRPSFRELTGLLSRLSVIDEIEVVEKKKEEEKKIEESSSSSNDDEEKEEEEEMLLVEKEFEEMKNVNIELKEEVRDNETVLQIWKDRVIDMKSKIKGIKLLNIQQADRKSKRMSIRMKRRLSKRMSKHIKKIKDDEEVEGEEEEN